MRLAAIDTGSNSIKLLVVDSTSNGNFIQQTFRYTVSGLSKDMTNNIISENSINKTEKIIGDYLDTCRALKVDELRITATAWARKAANANVLLERIHKHAGLLPEVIPGDEEARLTWLAVASCFAGDDLLVFNIGGGSTEFIRGKNSNVNFKTSLPFGAGQLSTEFLSSTDIIALAEYRNIKKFVSSTIKKDIIQPLKKAGNEIAPPGLKIVLSGGTGTNLAQIACGAALDWNNTLQHCITATQLSAAEQLLTGTRLAERIKIPGISPDRADVLPAGTAIATAVVSLFGASRLYLTNLSLSHGIIADMQNKIFPG